MQEFKHELLRICTQVVAQDEKGMKYIRRYYKIIRFYKNGGITVNSEISNSREAFWGGGR